MVLFKAYEIMMAFGFPRVEDSKARGHRLAERGERLKGGPFVNCFGG